MSRLCAGVLVAATCANGLDLAQVEGQENQADFGDEPCQGRPILERPAAQLEGSTGRVRKAVLPAKNIAGLGAVGGINLVDLVAALLEPLAQGGIKRVALPMVVGRLVELQTSVKSPFSFQNNRSLNSWKVAAGGQEGR